MSQYLFFLLLLKLCCAWAQVQCMNVYWNSSDVFRVINPPMSTLFGYVNVKLSISGAPTIWVKMNNLNSWPLNVKVAGQFIYLASGIETSWLSLPLQQDYSVVTERVFNATYNATESQFTFTAGTDNVVTMMFRLGSNRISDPSRPLYQCVYWADESQTNFTFPNSAVQPALDSFTLHCPISFPAPSISYSLLAVTRQLDSNSAVLVLDHIGSIGFTTWGYYYSISQNPAVPFPRIVSKGSLLLEGLFISKVGFDWEADFDKWSRSIFYLYPRQSSASILSYSRFVVGGQTW
eukprot:TRINITY_DN3342_c0_g2_i1.p1 TRINITY_DN3342_c0_g2~~TRINITY_DN3342_c0_g2_i1.p1  ORF type:complete len:292 (-),score=25.90 TRINITY_DN3342_c0_g2_i1:282-1157(-)